MVPNIKDVQSLSIAEITAELARLQQLAASNRISSADLSQGTITVSNIGSIGGKFATPLVTAREVAIVALGRVQRVPSWQEEGGTFLAKRVLPVSWGADHRVLDGAALANFNEAWKHLLQNPHLMLMHLR
ncbi:hypothetical protein WJX73_005936 [Symbiochloris irregularis]|uniref:2-oxoacid dehydrogenase acyltransferase catalytic domain-containing protein n=1 Tax=Symbiochloris irregularis TaxID=706552 RepID=A0AAW1NPX8_9CHLO